jgi:HlyD family secretion protein
MGVFTAWPVAYALAQDKAGTPAAKPALSVTVAKPERLSMPVQLKANGNVAAWQEASLGAEANGLKLVEVSADVGDVVKKGQLLARFARETVEADVAQARAQQAEAEAALGEARVNAQRAVPLKDTGALSQQQITQLLTLEKSAEARLAAAKALVANANLRLRHTRVVASDDGIVSARSATVGAVVPAGQELFRLIRQGRIEWRGEVTASELRRVTPGQSVLLTAPDGSTAQGKVRKVAPTVDAQTRAGLVYVDIPREAVTFKSGMYASGVFGLGERSALSLPESAVLLRDGFAVVYRIGANNRVAQVKVKPGSRANGRVEISEGIAEGESFVASGAAFLADGDLVRVVK